jgi:ubiquinone/menaquinone biosynthesis C-methylase UbiE
MSEQLFGKSYGADASENYERFFVPVIGRPLATELVGQASLRPGERILDVACGTGIVARLASQRVGATGFVAGLDINPGMLEVARSITPESEAIEWNEGNAEAMPLPDEAFDVVLCQMGLQFMPDRTGALKEMHRVLVEGGRLLVSMPGPASPLFIILADEIQRHISSEAAGFVRHVFSLHDTTEIQHLIGAAGFHDVAVQASLRTLPLPPAQEFLWQYVRSTPLAGIVSREEKSSLDALERDVLEKWKDFVENGALMFTQRIVVASARK